MINAWLGSLPKAVLSAVAMFLTDSLMINGENMITQERLKELLDYNPNTGLFSRKQKCYLKVGNVTHNGYLRMTVDGRSYTAHKLAWLYIYGEYPKSDIDHINHDRLDNRIENLRVVDRQNNMRNASLSKANTSGFTGVTWDRANQKWVAQIMIDGKTKKLGRFESMLDAVAERIRANKRYGFHKHHGGRYA